MRWQPYYHFIGFTMNKIFIAFLFLPFVLAAQAKDSLPSLYANISFDYLNIQSNLSSIDVVKYSNHITTSKEFNPNTYEVGIGVTYKMVSLNLEYMIYHSEYYYKDYHNSSIEEYKLDGSLLKPSVTMSFMLNHKITISLGGGMSFSSFKYKDTYSNIYGGQSLITYSENPSFTNLFLTTGFELRLWRTVSLYTKADYFVNNDKEIIQNENKSDVVTANETINHFDFSSLRATLGIRLYFPKE